MHADVDTIDLFIIGGGVSGCGVARDAAGRGLSVELAEMDDIDDQVQRKGYRNHPLSEADKARNNEIAVIRAGAERPFATYKSRYGLARTRLLGLARNLTFYGLAAIAHNIQKGGKFLTIYGLPEPKPTG